MRAAIEGNPNEAARILLVTGQAGAGKTHLVVREFQKHKHPAQCVLIYRPEAVRDFGKWLDHQLVAHLLRNPAKDERFSNALQEIAFDAVRTCFPRKAPRPSARNTAEAALTRAAEQHFAGRIAKALYEPFSYRRELRRHAETMALELGIAGEAGANDFCLSLLLLAGGSYTTDAVQVFTSRTTPTSLQGYLNDDLISQWSVRRLLSATLRRMGGGLVLFFDQLESLAVGDAAQPNALRDLLQSCVALVHQEPNAGCIVAALQEVAEHAVPGLAGPDRQRVRLPPAPQDLELVRRTRITDFLAPRLDYLEERSSRDAVLPLRQFANWVSEATELNQLSPRFILALMDSYGRLIGYNGRSASDKTAYRDAWDRTTAQFDQTSAEQLSSPDDDVENAWVRLQANFDPADFHISSAIDAVHLLGWSLETLGPPLLGVARAVVLIPEVDENGIASATLNVEFKGKSRETRSLFVLDQVNYRQKLRDAVARIAASPNRERKIVIRFREKFPAGGHLAKHLGAIRSAGGTVADFLDPEMLLLCQLRILHKGVESGDFDRWIRSKTLQLPALKACLRV